MDDVDQLNREKALLEAVERAGHERDRPVDGRRRRQVLVRAVHRHRRELPRLVGGPAQGAEVLGDRRQLRGPDGLYQRLEKDRVRRGAPPEQPRVLGGWQGGVHGVGHVVGEACQREEFCVCMRENKSAT